MQLLKKSLRTITLFLFPKEQWSTLSRIFAYSIYLKFLLFNIIWCIQTSFTPFSTVEMYLSTLLISLILLIPYTCFRQATGQLIILSIIDLLLIANLIYWRTYSTAIPLHNYMAATNLTDFGTSIRDTFRWHDLIITLPTLICLVAHLKLRHNANEKKWNKKHIASFLSLILVSFILMSFATSVRKGFRPAYESLMGANMHTCTTPMFTIFGNMLYNAMLEQEEYSPQIKQRIDNFLNNKPPHKPLNNINFTRNNVIIILAESLESWVLERSVENQEITPYINALIQEPNTLYAPNTLTQVKGGRSIDAQLLITAGMLPIHNGAFSIKAPSNLFHSLPKAMKQQYNSRNYLLTVDKKIVWNQHSVAKQFGYDSLLSKKNFLQDETIGTGGKRRLGDASFLKQCAEKITQNEVWQHNENAFMLIVTYSGHNPFVLPEELAKVHFPDKYPERMRHYMTTAHYTDHAIGTFINSIRSHPKYKNTIIVITGDHEGLSADRSSLASAQYGKGIVSDKTFVPFIVVNSPVAMRYEHVMGQVDIYPTLLNLLQLDNYAWKGIGQSILDPDKAPFAVGPLGDVQNLTLDIPHNQIQQAKEAYNISDLMIKFDYFNHPNTPTASHTSF